MLYSGLAREWGRREEYSSLSEVAPFYRLIALRRKRAQTQGMQHTCYDGAT